MGSPNKTNYNLERIRCQSSPGVGELISAVCNADLSSSLMTFKVSGIATCLVAVGTITVTWIVKSTLGVEDVCDNHILWLSVISPH